MTDRREHTPSNDIVRRGLKLSHLRLLVALRDLGQVAAAAQQTCMTQPAASRLLAQMAGMVGTDLFDRHPRGVVLTEAGQILAEQAAAVLQRLNLAQERIGQLIEGERGLVRVGSVTGPALEIVVPLIRRLRLDYPRIELTVQIDTSEKLAEALLDRDLDFYVGRIPERADARPFATEVIGPESVALAVRLDHPLTHIDFVNLENCLSYDWVMQPPGGLLRRTVEAYVLSRGLQLPKGILGTTSVLFTLALLHNTDAVAPLTRSVADFFVSGGSLGSKLVVLPIAEDMLVSDYSVVTRSQDALTPAADRLLRMISNRAKAVRQTAAHRLGIPRTFPG